MNAEAFLLILLLFWALLYLVGRFFHLDRYGLEIRPAYLLYKSERLSGALGLLSKRGSVLWRALYNVGLVLAVGQMIYVIYFLVDNILKFVRPEGAAIPLIPVLPGITIRLYWLPYFLVSAAIIVITHELAHGVAARLEKIPLESAGIFLALVFPGAFVVADEKRFEKASTLSKLRVLSAGSSINLATGLLVFLLLTALYAPASGILILETLEGGPLEKAGLQRWDTIYAINGTEISNSTGLDSYMATVAINETLILDTNEGNKIIVAAKASGDRAIIGLVRYSYYYPCRLGLGYMTAIHLHMTLNWAFLLVFSIVIFNMLPVYPFDGDKFLYYVLEKVVRGRGREVRILFNALCFGLIAANMILSLIRYGLPSL